MLSTWGTGGAGVGVGGGCGLVGRLSWCLSWVGGVTVVSAGAKGRGHTPWNKLPALCGVQPPSGLAAAAASGFIGGGLAKNID